MEDHLVYCPEGLVEDRARPLMVTSASNTSIIWSPMTRCVSGDADCQLVSKQSITIFFIKEESKWIVRGRRSEATKNAFA